MTKTFALFVLASTLTVSALTATPASAAALTPVTITCDNINNTLKLSSNNIGARPLDTITVTNSSGVNVALALNAVTSTANTLSNTGTATITLQGLNGSVTFTSTGGTGCGNSAITLTFIAGGGGGGGSTSVPAPAPQTFDLSLNPSGGTTCKKPSESGVGGTWITLPAATDCTPPSSTPNATLLGWATSPNFPIEIAKRQVDNGWGAYETSNDDGQLTGVFIPAGGATFLSASGKLFPIWSE